MSSKKSINGAVLFLVLILVLGNAVFGGLYVYEKFSKEEVKEQSDSKNMDEKEENKKLDIASKMVEDLYSSIPTFEGLVDHKSVYQNKLINVGNFESEYLRSFAFSKLDIDKISKEPVKVLNDDGELVDIVDENWFSFDAKILQDKMLELYNNKIEDGSFEVSYAASASYEDGKYQFGVGGTGSYYSYLVRNIDSAYDTEDELVIEDKFLYVLYGSLNDDGNYSIEIYDTSDKKNMIYKENTDESILSINVLNSYINKNLSKMKKYKHVFKKNTKGNYYWVSTEPIV